MNFKMLKIVLLVTFLVGYACNSKTQPASIFLVKDIAADIVFTATKTATNRKPFLTLKAVGTVDDSTEISVRNPRQPQKIYWKTYVLPKGTFDTITHTMDYYDFTAEVVYAHKNARKGHLSLTVAY